MTFELEINVSPTYKPLNKDRLNNSLSKRRQILDKTYAGRLDTKNYAFPHAKSSYFTHIAFPHNMLLGNDCHLQAISEVVRKIRRYSKEIPRYVS